MTQTLQEIIKKRILVLDGAMGTMIQQENLTEEDFRGQEFQNIPGLMKGNNEILNLTRPDVITDIHRRYLEAGADIIETNTFSAQRISQADYHVESFAKEMAVEGCRIARRIADEYTQKDPTHPRFVAGSVGPTNKTLSISPDVNDPALRSIDFDTLSAAYEEQIHVMITEKVDAILIETIFDTLNAKAAIYAARKAMKRAGREVPIMLSATVSDEAGRTLSGQTLDAFLASIAHAHPFSVGLNCSFGAAKLKPFVQQMAQHSDAYISVFPNAGLPNSLGQYDETPEHMAGEMKEYIDEQLVNIIGGCCGTTDAFIAKYPALIKGATPHVPAQKPQYMQLSGLELFEVTPEKQFINIGERCNVAGSRKFLRLISEKQYEEALSIARKQVEDGALVLDINMDDGLLDAQEEMKTFLNLMMSDPDIACVPVMIDSSKWDVISTGLKCVQGKAIVNSISLKEGEEPFVRHALEIKEMGAAAVVMAFDEKGQAVTYERKIEVCQRAYRILVDKVGFNPLDIIFDPNVLTIATGMEEHNKYALDFIRATEWIRKNLPGAHISGGISNLSFAFRGNNYIREAMHAVFLYHAINVGLDFGIVNPSSKVTYSDIEKSLLEAIEDVIFDRSPEAAEHLIAKAVELKAAMSNTKEETTVQAWRNGTTVEERLGHALEKGIPDYLEEDLQEAVDKYPDAVSIIEGPLMNAMNHVGELFGSGKMFLPQVVKTARTMKKAVNILQPYIEAKKNGEEASRGRILLATVKGDVHDIGKNIVSVIMACNNFEVIDLGVMVPPEKIVEAAIREHADIIGLSGLITPSLEEMVRTAHLLDQAGVKAPILIGGATTSELHTALKIAPVYSAPVIWMKDASQNVTAAAKLMNPTERVAYKETLDKQYEALRHQYNERQKPALSLEESRNRKPDLF